MESTGGDCFTNERHSPLTIDHSPDRRSGEDRRKEVRLASRTRPATLCVDERTPLEVQVRDVSRSGMGLTAAEPVIVGSEVLVVCGGLMIYATVCHCRENGTGEYWAGISINRIVNTGDGREI